jgi:predicted nuclease with RNAse H fold
MRTLGIDLAADPARTAACLIEWSDGHAAIVRFEAGCGDDRLIELARSASHIGIDSPLGWPDAFVAAVRDHAAGRRWPGLDAPDAKAFRRTLSLRATDEAVAAGGPVPLSVSTDRLGITAMRCAVIVGMLERSGRAVARDGSGEVVEVYPAAALRRWQSAYKGYKAGPAAPGVREAIVAGLAGRTPWLRFDDADRARCVASDHLLDALVAALVTRAAALGLTERPPPRLVEQARREGWIHVPVPGSLPGLAAAARAGPPPASASAGP